jgi:hypothetical protein
MGALSQPESIQDAPVPFLGWSLRCLIGELEGDDELHTFESINPPDTYDLLLKTLAFAAPIHSTPIDSNWTRCVFSPDIYRTNAVSKYKPVDWKVRPVPS